MKKRRGLRRTRRRPRGKRERRQKAQRPRRRRGNGTWQPSSQARVERTGKPHGGIVRPCARCSRISVRHRPHPPLPACPVCSSTLAGTDRLERTPLSGGMSRGEGLHGVWVSCMCRLRANDGHGVTQGWAVVKELASSSQEPGLRDLSEVSGLLTRHWLPISPRTQPTPLKINGRAHSLLALSAFSTHGMLCKKHCHRIAVQRDV